MRIPAVLAVVASSLPAQSWSWVRAGYGASRFNYSIAASPSGSVLLFGGYDLVNGIYLGDTQQWNPASGSWSLLSVASPGGRSFHAMAVDSFRSRVVMFGGGAGSVNPSCPTLLADTWEWTGVGWQARNSLANPSPRSNHAMAFDPVRNRVVLFGGRNGCLSVVGDTWEWDGAQWTQSTPAQQPSPRSDHAMAFDPVRGQVMLYGGSLVNTVPSDGSTWEWDGTTWTQLMPAVSPGPRVYHAMATDPRRRRVLLHGGFAATGFSDTWEWNGSAWTLLANSAAPASVGPMAFCAQESRILCLNVLDAYELYPPSPNVRSYGAGCGGLALAATPNSQPLLGQTFTSQLTGCPPATVIAFMALGFSDQALGSWTLPLDLGVYGMPGCLLYHDAVAICLPCQLAGSVATHSIALPNDPSLTGTMAFLQGWTSTPGANPAGVLTSSALALTFGY